MARVVEDESKFEVWQSAVRGKVYVSRIDRRGEIIGECVTGGAVLHITPDERRFNSEQAAREKNDPFRNGALVPVKLIEEADDVIEIQNNPNHLGESAMRNLLKDRRAYKQLQDQIDQVDNALTLTRWIQIAHEEDASVKQVERLEARLEAIKEQPFTQVEQIASGPYAGEATRVRENSGPKR